MSLLGLHHVSAICSDAQKNADFYVNTLGLRLVKVTVNFDDPQSYHLYYGDATGSPGSIMTFFVWPGGHRGRIGPPQVTATAYAIPSSLDRFLAETVARRGRDVFVDRHTLRRTVHARGRSGRCLDRSHRRRWNPIGAGYEGSTVDAQHTLRKFHSVTLHERALDRTASTLTKNIDLVEVSAEGDVRRYAMNGGGVGKFVDVHFDATKSGGHQGAGIVHHVAYRVSNDAEQLAWQRRLVDGGLQVTPVAERTYFRSIYFREPGGVLFEIATDAPGFAVDEEGGIGRSLRIPPWFEQHRASILNSLPKFSVGGVSFP